MAGLEVEKINGIGRSTLERLHSAGIYSVEALAVLGSRDLSLLTGLSEDKCLELCLKARKMLQTEIETADKILERRRKILRITTGSGNLDRLLGGGIETQAITELVGEYGSAKTQICHTLAVTVQLPPEQGGAAPAATLYIDTEGTFRPERVKEIAEARKLNPDDVLKNIYVAPAYSSDHLTFLVDEAFRFVPQKNVKLILVDSIVGRFRPEYLGREALAERQQKLNRILSRLLKLTEAYNLAVVVTNQVISHPGVFYGNPDRPAGGHILGHNCLAPETLIVTLESLKPISQLHNPDLVLGFMDGEFDTYPVTERVNVAASEVFEINNALKASGDHRIFVFDKKSHKIKEVAVKDLTKDHYLLLPRKIEVPERKLHIPEINYEEVYIIENPAEVKEKLRNIFPIKNKQRCTQQLGIIPRQLRRILNQNYPTRRETIERIEALIGKIKVRRVETLKHRVIKKIEVLTPPLAQFFGYFIGDGSQDFYNNAIRLKEQRYEVALYYAKLLQEIFGLKPKIVKVKGKRCYEVKIANKYVTMVLKYLIENLHKIFYCNEETIKSFVRGLFDAEGSVATKRTVSLAMKNEKMLHFVRLLLLRLGIHATLCRDPHILKLSINKRQYSSIGFTAKDKQEKLLTYKRYGCKGKIPVQKAYVLKLLKEYGIKVSFNHPELFISYEELKMLCDRHEIARKFFGSLLNFHYEPIYSKRRIQISQPLIDIETTCENFIANGYLVHNSTYRIWLKRGKNGIRTARIFDSPYHPEAETQIQITGKGIEDPPQKKDKESGE